MKAAPNKPLGGQPPKESSKSSSEEEPPTDKAPHDEARQRARQLDTHFDAWHRKKIAKGIMGWATRDNDLQPPQAWEDAAQSSRPCGAALRLHERVSGLRWYPV